MIQKMLQLLLRKLAKVGEIRLRMYRNRLENKLDPAGFHIVLDPAGFHIVSWIFFLNLLLTFS